MNNGEIIRAIDPKNGDKFLREFHAWLRKHAHRIPGPLEARRSRNWGLVIGAPEAEDPSWFHGAAMSVIEANSDRATVGVFTPSIVAEWTPLPDFWAEYIRIGMCAVDTDHHRFGGRYETVDATTRRCKWCGRVETLRMWTETVQRAEWEVSP